MAFVSAQISARQDWAEGLCTLQLQAEYQSFKAGQFFNLALDSRGERVRRSYSAASAPGAPLEFFLTGVVDGALSPSLVELQVGAEVLLDPQPQGFFTFDYIPPADDLWLLCTGTGLGPFISMLRTDEPWQRSQRIIVAHGVRQRDHLAYAAELQRMVAARSDWAELKYVPLVTREQPPPSGLAGRIPAALIAGTLERACGVELVPERAHVLLCGNPEMIRAAQLALETRGLRKHRQRKPGHVSFEKYW